MRLAIPGAQAQDVAAGVNGVQVRNQSRIAVLGASGYTGEEVVRLLALHPTFAVKVLTGETQAGKVSVTEVFADMHGLRGWQREFPLRQRSPSGRISITVLRLLRDIHQKLSGISCASRTLFRLGRSPPSLFPACRSSTRCSRTSSPRPTCQSW